ncbi:hypothetical protein QCA50_002751 [Cerrena zonata]|uniref:Uncharacterized protein n=1 Tax=Cerrena zonata TaxID=2478898 RepID=A0AAW0GQ70_9APHY
MTGHVSQSEISQAHAADTEYFVRRGMTKGYQIASLVAPPIYVAFVLSRYGRSHLTINRALRSTWVGGATGLVGGGAFEYVRSAYSDPENVRTRRIRAAYDTASIRADDHSTIGGILFAVLMPAVFWKRASAVNLVLGGAGIGSALGVLTHHGRSISGDPPPATQIPGRTVGS